MPAGTVFTTKLTECETCLVSSSGICCLGRIKPKQHTTLTSSWAMLESVDEPAAVEFISDSSFLRMTANSSMKLTTSASSKVVRQTILPRLIITEESLLRTFSWASEFSVKSCNATRRPFFSFSFAAFAVLPNLFTVRWGRPPIANSLVSVRQFCCLRPHVDMTFLVSFSLKRTNRISLWSFQSSQTGGKMSHTIRL